MKKWLTTQKQRVFGSTHTVDDEFESARRDFKAFARVLHDVHKQIHQLASNMKDVRVFFSSAFS